MRHGFRQITPTDKFSWHLPLLPVYDRLFRPLKMTEKGEHGHPEFRRGRLLEIGTDGGGGLMMYADYFPHWEIFGIDIAPTPDGIKGKERITHFVKDAYSTYPTNIFGNTTFDIIIDDGPHFIDPQMFFVHFYPHLLTKDGIAIIEDIQKEEYIPKLAAAVPVGFIGYAIDLRGVRDAGGEFRYDNLIFVIERA